MALKVGNGLDLQTQQLKNLADGSAATDGVNLQQLQAYVRGLSWKGEVKVASTANVTLTAPGATIDGITMVSGDRMLLKNQTTASQNGLYTWQGASSTATRTSDASAVGPDGVQTLTAGLAVFVTQGTVNADTAWVLQTADPITVDTTSLTFAAFGGGGTIYTAASTGGLSLSGSAFSVKLPASSGLITDATGTYLDTTIAARKFSVNIGDSSSTSITVTHNLGTRDVTVKIYDATAFNEILTDVVHTTTNTVTVTFATAPASNAYRCVVMG